LNTIITWFRGRMLRLIGGLIVFVSAGLLVFLVMLDIFSGVLNPYIGVVAYLILPVVLIIGLILVPLDAWLRRRRQQAGVEAPEYPVIDLCDPTQRKIFSFFVVASIIEFMDTVTFCGRVCHRVMNPEYTAYLRGPHASVACVECHIGPGAPWFVRSKLTGIPQVYHYITNTYPRPIPTPVQALRPARDTCDTCHWPERFYGNELLTMITYDTDRANTEKVQTMIMRVGSGGQRGSGIHSHIVNQVWYLPANAKRSEMAWVYLRRLDGTTAEFINPMYQKMVTPERLREQKRFMDCIDCHNRPAHEFDPFEQLFDSAITQGLVDRKIPFIKKEVMDAVGSVEQPPTTREYQETLRRIAAIEGTYRRNMPDVYSKLRTEIRGAVNEAAVIYRGTVFPHMRVGPNTYPNWRSHAGCFRCHGVIVNRRTQETLSSDCTLCHTLPGGS
jgi:hypothetical protein